LWLALGVCLAIVGTAHLFIAWAALHLVLIVLFPALLLLLISWLIWKALRRRRATASETGLANGLSPVPPATALLLLGLFVAQSKAAEPVHHSPVSIESAAFTG